LKRRIETLIQDSTEVAAGEPSQSDDVVEKAPSSASMKSDRFLSPLSIDESSDPIGPCESESGDRCSDKGFLPRAMPIEDYLALLDWTARQVVPGKRGSTPNTLPPVLARLGWDTACWCELVSDFGRLFCSVAGRPERVDSMRCQRTQRRYPLRRRARERLTAGD